MLLRNITSRGVVLRDSTGKQYNISAYGTLQVLDSLLNDQQFLNFLRLRYRALIIVTAQTPISTDLTGFGTLTPFDGNEVYLEVAAGIRWHLIFNANSASLYKWEFLGGPPLRSEILTTQDIEAAATWSNLDTDGPAVSAPRAGDYDATLHLVTHHTTATSNAKATIQVGNTDGSGAQIINEDDTDAIKSGSVTKRLLAVSASGSIKARYYSDTEDELPSFSNRVLEVRPVRII